MSTLLLRHMRLLVAMDAARREIPDGAVLIRDREIAAVGPTAELPETADRVIDLAGHVVLPGLVNTHHHLFQSLTRALPGTQNARLFEWLSTLYPIWAGLDGNSIYLSARTALCELLLSGCTTTSDHLYLYPNGARLDDEIRAARELGIRFHPCFGSMSLGRSEGGLPPDEVVQDEDEILREGERVVAAFHDPARLSMCRIALAPCAPFNVSQDLLRRTLAWARAEGLRLHTHIAETRDEETFCHDCFGLRPVAYMERLGWLGPDVWFAHGIYLNPEEIALLARTGTGVTHCPSSNMRLGSGIAPIRALLDAGVPVGLAVDGSASNDSSNLLAEARQAMLLQRVALGADALTARETLEMATIGGARLLGRDDIGALVPGMAADLIAINVERLDYAGAQADPLAALVFCTPPRVDLSIIDGHIVVERGELLGVDLAEVSARHNEEAARLLRQANS